MVGPSQAHALTSVATPLLLQGGDAGPNPLQLGPHGIEAAE
jgi:hypothetical protein